MEGTKYDHQEVWKAAVRRMQSRVLSKVERETRRARLIVAKDRTPPPIDAASRLTVPILRFEEDKWAHYNPVYHPAWLALMTKLEIPVAAD